MPLEGKQIGRYHIVRVLGSGGMGEVYLAEDARIGQQVAIKVMRTELSLSDEKTRDDTHLFLREAKAIAMLDHPRILPLYDFGDAVIDTMTFTYLVMPYRPEGSLSDWLRHQGSATLSLQEGVHLLGQAAEALQHAHDHHIVHQDVKPSNFLIRARKEYPLYPDLFLTDFGIARLTTATSNASQAVRGTPTYMAPEQWEGEPVAATDQYALAIMMYELLTGRPPFQGNPARMMFQHLNIPPPAPSTLHLRIPPAIDAVLLRALAKQPQNRFETVSVFASTFRQAMSAIMRSTSISSEPNLPPTFVRPQNTPSGDSFSTVRKPITAANVNEAATHRPSPVIPGSLDYQTGSVITPHVNDIRATLAISRDEAVNGTTRTITLPGGRQVIVTIPPHILDGHMIRVENTDEAGQTKGDVLLMVSVQDARMPVQNMAEVMTETALLDNVAIQPPQLERSMGETQVASPTPAPLLPTPASADPITPASVGTGSAVYGGGRGGIPLQPRRRRRRVPLGFGIIFLVLLVALGIVIATVPGLAYGIFGGSSRGVITTHTTPTVVPPASAAFVSITPTKKEVKNTFDLTAVPGSPDANKRQLQAGYPTGVRIDSKTVNATGQGTTKATTAQGTLTFINASTTYKLVVPSGTTWTATSGVTVVDDEAVTLQPASGPNYSYGYVKAHTTTTGASANIVSQDINQCAASYFQSVSTTSPTAKVVRSTSSLLSYTVPNSGCGASVSNDAAFTGGKDAQAYTTVSQDDITGTESQLVTVLTPLAQQDAKNAITANDKVMTDVFCNHHTSSNNAVGTAATQVTVTTKVTCSYETYDQNAAQSLAEQLLKDQAVKEPGNGYALQGNVTKKIIKDSIDYATGIITISVYTAGVWVYQFNDRQKQELRELIAGKSQDMAKDLLLKKQGVGQATIQLKEASRKLLPVDPGNITIDVQK